MIVDNTPVWRFYHYSLHETTCEVIRSLRVTSVGIEIVYDDVGEGEPTLLFMSGWCCDRTVFRPGLTL
jgi:hypothetical protein